MIIRFVAVPLGHSRLGQMMGRSSCRV